MYLNFRILAGRIYPFFMKVVICFAVICMGKSVNLFGKSLIPNINIKLLGELQIIVSDYKEETGKFPISLDEILKIFQQKFSFREPPRAVQAEIIYNNTTGFVSLIRKRLPFKDVVVLNDESEIYCNIEKDLGNEILIRHSYGTLKMPKADIKSTGKIFTNEVYDKEVVLMFQTYIQTFQFYKGLCPDSINELKRFLREYYIDYYPAPSAGYIVLEKESCNIRISHPK